MPSECAGALQKKKRTHVTAEAEGSAGNEKEPCSFVFGRGPVIRSVRELIHDTRTMMMPNTAKRMRVPPSRHTVHHCATLARLATVTGQLLYAHALGASSQRSRRRVQDGDRTAHIVQQAPYGMRNAPASWCAASTSGVRAGA
jgi:hypothetical protein